MVKVKTCVFISGEGTNLKNLVKRSRNYNFPIKISLVVSNKAKARGLNYAKKYSIPFLIINTKNRNFENLILNNFNRYQIELVCLAGYMKIISKNFLRKCKKKIINIHPSLLPKFKGLNTFKRVLENKQRKTGCTVHYVNEKLDSGYIIKQRSFFINPSDNETSLKRKTQILEYKIYPEAVIEIFRNNQFLKKKLISFFALSKESDP